MVTWLEFMKISSLVLSVNSKPTSLRSVSLILHVTFNFPGLYLSNKYAQKRQNSTLSFTV